MLDVPGWPGHRAGQHVDVRLTAEDGYQAQRSYSIASAPEDDRARAHGRAARRRRGLALPGRRAARRRPARAARADRRLLRLGRASGRPAAARRGRLGHRAADGDAAPPRRRRQRRRGAAARLVAHGRRRHLRGRARAAGAARRASRSSHTLTRARARRWRAHAGASTQAMLAEVGWEPADGAAAASCAGRPACVEAVASGLVALGHGPERIRTERFGPTGG